MNRPPVHTRWYGKAPTNGINKRRGAALIASAALAAGALSALPASATVVNVAAGHNITVFHNIDFVAVFGYPLGEEITVDVLRRGVTIGTATGATVDTPEGPGLEVNHGPAAAAVPGDCWVGTTPDIQPGDRVRVTASTGVDEVVVDNIRFTGDPAEASNGDILVPFDAFRANGTAIPASFIDSAEFRAASNNSVRFEGADVLVQRRPGARAGQYQMRYRSPFTPTRNDDEAPFNQRQLRTALLGDGHATGFGHVAAPLPSESMLLDGLADTPGPAPGCAAPSAQWGVNAVTPGTINRANLDRGLTVRGIATGASAVRVTLTDRTGPAVTGNATVAGDNWSAKFTRAQLRSLDGRINVAGFYTLAAGEISGVRQTLSKDLVRPNKPRASLRTGTYRRTKRVALQSNPANEIRYTLGKGRQARPTATRGTLYRGRIRISSTQVLKAVAVDPSGNVSQVQRRRYRIAR